MAAPVSVPENNEEACEVFIASSTAADWPLTRRDKFQRVLDMFEQELQARDEELRLRDQELEWKCHEVEQLREQLAARADSAPTPVPAPSVEAEVDLSRYFGKDAPGPCTLRGPPEHIAAVLSALAKSKPGAAGAAALGRLSRGPGDESMFTVFSNEDCDSCLSTPRTAGPSVEVSVASRRNSLRPRLPGLELGALSQLSIGSHGPDVSFAPRETPQGMGTPRVANTPRNLCLGTPRAAPFVATPRSQSRVYTLVTPRGAAAALQPPVGGLSPVRQRPGPALQRLQETPAEDRSSLGSRTSATDSEVEPPVSPIAHPTAEVPEASPQEDEPCSDADDEPAAEPAEPSEATGDAAPTTPPRAFSPERARPLSPSARLPARTPERVMLEATPRRTQLRLSDTSPEPKADDAGPVDQQTDFASQLLKLGPESCATALRSLSPGKQLAVAQALQVIAAASLEVSASEEALRHDPFASPKRRPSTGKVTTPAEDCKRPQESMPWRLTTPLKRKEAAVQLAAKAKEGGSLLGKKMAAKFESFSNVGQKATNALSDRWAEEVAFRYAQHQMAKR